MPTPEELVLIAPQPRSWLQRFEPMTPYATAFWLPTIGVVNFHVWSMLVETARCIPPCETYAVVVELSAARLGITREVFVESLRELESFDLLRHRGDNLFLVALAAPEIGGQQLRQLVDKVPSLWQLHEHLLGAADGATL